MLIQLFRKLCHWNRERAIHNAMRRLPQYHALRQQLIDDDIERAMIRARNNLSTYASPAGLEKVGEKHG